MTEVAVVRALYRYPVKSMAGETLNEIELSWHGFQGDRRFAFVRTSELVGMPWLTASRVPELLLYKPQYANDDIAKSSVLVKTPDGLEMALSDARLSEQISRLYGSDVHPMRLDSGIFDQASLSLISQETIAAMSDETSRDLEIARFRPNIVVELLDGQSFAEDTWVGRRLTFGTSLDASAMRATERDIRCVMVNIDPTTLEKDASVLKTIAQQHETCLGIYGSVERRGRIRVGDIISLED
ncbi:MAG: MOSC domain-containing protein [Anaerolineaceae bacterium]|nr:MOSC domain-containing protein [Anaerolineaceae bacterium]